MAAKFIRIEGIEKVTKNLLNAEESIQRNVRVGMRKAARVLLSLSNKVVPRQTGNLRGSGFVRAHGTGANFGVAVGYTAAYAVFVHENLDAAHGAAFNQKHAEKIAKAKGGSVTSNPFFNRGPKQQAKFLEGPARQNLNLLLGIIEKAAAKKPKV